MVQLDSEYWLFTGISSIAQLRVPEGLNVRRVFVSRPIGNFETQLILK